MAEMSDKFKIVSLCDFNRGFASFGRKTREDGDVSIKKVLSNLSSNCQRNVIMTPLPIFGWRRLLRYL